MRATPTGCVVAAHAGQAGEAPADFALTQRPPWHGGGDRVEAPTSLRPASVGRAELPGWTRTHRVKQGVEDGAVPAAVTLALGGKVGQGAIEAP